MTEKVLVNKLLVSEKMLRGKYLVSEVILDNKILCPSMSWGTILMQTATEQLEQQPVSRSCEVQGPTFTKSKLAELFMNFGI